MRLPRVCRLAIAVVCVALVAGCEGTKIPRAELGKVDLGPAAVPFRDQEVPLPELPPPKSPTARMMEQ